MLKKFRKRLNKKGFTLVELIVVIAVLGILASIAIPNFTGMKNKAKKAVDDQALATMQKGIELYKAEHDEYPDTQAEVDTAIALVFDSIPIVEQAGTDKKFYFDQSAHEVVILESASATTDDLLID